MKKFLLFFSFILLTTELFAAKQQTEAKTKQNGPFGIGIIIGEPSGITLKYWLDKTSAIDLALAWSFEKEASFRIHGDYLWHFRDVLNVPHGDLMPYIGGGLLVNISDKAKVGIRVPLGLEYFLNSIPLEIFLELVPVLNIVPATTMGANVGIGIRFYF